MTNSLRIIVVALAAALALAPGVGLAVTSLESEPAAPDPRLVQAERAVKAKEWAKAIGILERYVAENPRDADGFNLLGYSHRKRGDMDKALAYYTRALAIDANHRGANEYLGELYLEMNDLAKAEERLAVLARVCGPRCEEYRELRGEIEKFKAGKPRS